MLYVVCPYFLIYIFSNSAHSAFCILIFCSFSNRSNSSDEEIEKAHETACYLNLVFSAIGIFFNFISIFVFSQEKLRKRQEIAAKSCGQGRICYYSCLKNNFSRIFPYIHGVPLRESHCIREPLLSPVPYLVLHAFVVQLPHFVP